jgi:hypothetical protein
VTDTSNDPLALSGSASSCSEASVWHNDGETIDVIDDEPVGEEITENVPSPDSGDQVQDADCRGTSHEGGRSA